MNDDQHTEAEGYSSADGIRSGGDNVDEKPKEGAQSGIAFESLSSGGTGVENPARNPQGEIQEVHTATAVRGRGKSDSYVEESESNETKDVKLRERQEDTFGKPFEHESPLGEDRVNEIHEKIAKTGDIPQQGSALAIDSTTQGSTRVQHDDKRNNLEVSRLGAAKETGTDSDDGLKSKGDSLHLAANAAETRTWSNGKSSVKEEPENVRVAGDEGKSQNQIDNPDQRQAALFLTPNFNASDSVQFGLPKSGLEIQTGTKLEAGKLYEIKGRVEGVYVFDEYRFLNESPRVMIHVPKEYIKDMRAGEKYQITILSIEDKNVSAAVSEILTNLKRGQNWRYIANHTKFSLETTPKDLKWLTESRVPHHRIPLEDSLRNTQGTSNERWKMYLGKLIERELSSQSRAKEGRNPRDTSQNRSEITNRLKSEVPPTAHMIKPNSGRQHNATPRGVINGENPARGALASAEQTSFADTVEQRVAQVERRQDKIKNPSGWEWVAGFFDGEGSILLHVRKYSIGVEVTFAQKYVPLLDSVQELLRNEGIKSSSVYNRGRAHNLSIHSNEEVTTVLREMLPHLRLKENQARAALDYLENRINAIELVQIFNQEVEAGRRSGNRRALPDQTLYRTESIRRFRETQMKKAHHALHKALDRLDDVPEV